MGYTGNGRGVYLVAEGGEEFAELDDGLFVRAAWTGCRVVALADPEMFSEDEDVATVERGG